MRQRILFPQGAVFVAFAQTCATILNEVPGCQPASKTPAKAGLQTLPCTGYLPSQVSAERVARGAARGITLASQGGKFRRAGFIPPSNPRGGTAELPFARVSSSRNLRSKCPGPRLTFSRWLPVFSLGEAAMMMRRLSHFGLPANQVFDANLSIRNKMDHLLK